MEKGFIVFAHTDSGLMHDYFKETLFVLSEKVAALFQFQIVESLDETAKAALPNPDILPGMPSHIPVRVLTFEAEGSYLHQILTGFAEYIQHAVEHSVCRYFQLKDS